MTAREIRAIVPQPADWVTLALNGGFTGAAGGAAGYTPAARLHGSTVELCGIIAGTFTTGGVAVMTLPAQFRPASTVKVGVTTNAATITGFAVITSAGVVTITTSAAATGVSLDGESFRLI